MKIIYFTDTFLPQINGVVTSVSNFSKKLAKRGHEIYIFTIKTKDTKPIHLGDNIHIRHFKSSSFMINYPDFKIAYPSIYRTMKEVRKIKPDIIHTHTPSPQAWTALTISKIYKIPILSTYHTLLPDFLEHTPLKKVNKKVAKGITWQYTRSYYNKVDVVVTPSNAMAEELKKHRIRKHIEAISNGIDTKMFYNKHLSHKGTKLLHVGRVSYEKNIDVILKAVRILIKQNKNITLDIVGNGPDFDNLKALSKKLGLENNVSFKGSIPHEKLVDVYNSHDIFVTASTIETEGLVILEAMACGLPVVGVRKLAIPDIVKHNHNGFVAVPGNYEEIAKYIGILVKDKKKRDLFSKYSEKISKDYDLDMSIDRIERIYQALIDKKKHRKRKSRP